MALIRMALTNYRCFAKRQEIELRPVTVVLGRNNSGKSALVRAPLVLSTGIRTDSPSPLDLDLLGEDIVDSFTDLIYGGRPHGSLDIELEFNDEDWRPLRLAATVQNIDEYRTQVVSSLELRSLDRRFQFEWEPSETLDEVITYTVNSEDVHLSNVPVEFQGLLPRWPPQDRRLGLDFAAILFTIRDCFDTIRYLGPFRDRPARFYRLPARMPAEIGVSGENTAGILASDLTRQQGRLMRQINQDLGGNLPDWSIEVVERGGMYAVLLRSHNDDTLTVNLADTGTGVAQALPIFVQRALDVLKPPSRPVLEIIEQPELHLHPAAHGALADLYLQAAQRTRVRFLIETHSETLLLRLRRRIAEGIVAPDMVAIYFVENHDGVGVARPINVDVDGNLDYWPEGVFSEDYQETKELAKAQLARMDTDAR